MENLGMSNYSTIEENDLPIVVLKSFNDFSVPECQDIKICEVIIEDYKENDVPFKNPEAVELLIGDPVNFKRKSPDVPNQERNVSKRSATDEQIRNLPSTSQTTKNNSYRKEDIPQIKNIIQTQLPKKSKNPTVQIYLDEYADYLTIFSTNVSKTNRSNTFSRNDNTNTHAKKNIKSFHMKL